MRRTDYQSFQPKIIVARDLLKTVSGHNRLLKLLIHNEFYWIIVIFGWPWVHTDFMSTPFIMALPS